MATSVDKPPPLARRHLVLLAVVAAGLAAATAAWMLTRRVDAPTGLLQVNGRIEGDRVTIASKFAGRVIELAAREGDAVSAGQRWRGSTTAQCAAPKLIWLALPIITAEWGRAAKEWRQAMNEFAIAYGAALPGRPRSISPALLAQPNPQRLCGRLFKAPHAEIRTGSGAPRHIARPCSPPAPRRSPHALLQRSLP